MPKQKKQTKEVTRRALSLQAFGVLDYLDGFPTPDECFPANGVRGCVRTGYSHIFPIGPQQAPSVSRLPLCRDRSGGV